MTGAQVLDLTTQFLASSQAAERLVAALPAAALARRPRPGSWSPAECLTHLALTGRSYLPAMEKAIGGLRAAGRATTRPSRPDLIGRLLAWSLEPPARVRTKTTTPFVPQTLEPAAVLPDFLAQQEQLLALLRQTEGLDLAAARVPSSFDARIGYNVLSAFRILAAHQRRHLWQAEQARSSSPAS